MIIDASGILGTNVQWSKVELSMQAALNTTATFGANKSVRPIGEGDGFTSLIGLVTCDWTDAHSSENLPVQFAIKVVEADHQILTTANIGKVVREEDLADFGANAGFHEQMLRQIHNHESAIYAYLDALPVKLAVPRCYYAVLADAENSDTAHIAMEYLDKTKICRMYENLSIKQVKEIAREIGKFQAATLGISGVDFSSDAIEGMMAMMTKDEAVVEKKIRTLTKSDASPELAKMIDSFVSLIPMYAGTTLCMTAHKSLGLVPILAHGDLWSGNILIDEQDGRLRSIVDWQGAHLSCPAEDLVRLLVTGISLSDRRAHMDEIIDELYDSLLANLKSGQEVPYTREQLSSLTRILLPHMVFTMITMATPMCELITNDSRFSPEENERHKEGWMEKIRGMFETFFEMHELNAAGTHYQKPALHSRAN